MTIERLDDIIKFYLRNPNFWLDLMLLASLISMILYPLHVLPGLIGYFGSLVNLIALKRMEQSITFTLFSNNNQRQYFKLLKLLLTNCLISHVASTLLLGITHINRSEWNWMDKYGIAGETWLVKYIYAVYWGAGLVFMVSFGDISIANTDEAALLIFIVMTGCLILAYNINHVKMIIFKLT